MSLHFIIFTHLCYYKPVDHYYYFQVDQLCFPFLNVLTDEIICCFGIFILTANSTVVV